MIETLIAFVVLANASRVTPIAPDLELSQRAQARAELLCARGQWSHDGWLDSFWDRGERPAGENLAKDFDSPAEIQKAWLNSPTHKANVVDPRFSKMGIGQSCDITVALYEG